LRAEVERLREHRESCTEKLLKGYETGKTEERAAERAAVVAWLRKECMEAASKTHRTGESNVLFRVAQIIERGEHRRGEEG
jgi:hypothetical protein